MRRSRMFCSGRGGHLMFAGGGHIFDYVHFKKIKIFMDFFREGGGSTLFLYLNPRIQLNVATIEESDIKKKDSCRK